MCGELVVKPIEERQWDTALVMVVESDARRRGSLMNELLRTGFAVTSVNDGAEAFALAARYPFDVVLAELELPHLDGWGLVQKLRDDVRTREIATALLSEDPELCEVVHAISRASACTAVHTLLEPRREAMLMLDAGEEFVVPAGVGAQWLVRELARRGFNGLLNANDGWSTFELFFADGELHCQASQSDLRELREDRALAAFLSADRVGCQVLPGSFRQERSPTCDTEAMLSLASARLHGREESLRQAFLLDATAVEVVPERLALYRRFAVPEWRAWADQICSRRLCPGDALTQLDLSPKQIDELYRDLLRREVIRLTHQKKAVVSIAV